MLSRALIEDAGRRGRRRRAPRAHRRPHRLSQRHADADLGHAAGHDRARIPVKPGTHSFALLQPRRRAEHALLEVIQEATCTAGRRGRSIA